MVPSVTVGWTMMVSIRKPFRANMTAEIINVPGPGREHFEAQDHVQSGKSDNGRYTEYSSIIYIMIPEACYQYRGTAVLG